MFLMTWLNFQEENYMAKKKAEEPVFIAEKKNLSAIVAKKVKKARSDSSSSESDSSETSESSSSQVRIS